MLDKIRIETVQVEHCWLRSIEFDRRSDAHLSVSQPSHIESEEHNFISQLLTYFVVKGGTECGHRIEAGRACQKNICGKAPVLPAQINNS